MYYFLSLALTISIVSHTLQSGENMESNFFKVRVSCRNNPECIFDGQDIIIDFFMKNTSGHPIEFPLQYLRRKGLHCFLEDNLTHKKLTLGISLTSEEIKRDFSKLGIDEEVTLSRKITAESIRFLRNEMVNVTVNVAATGFARMHEDSAPSIFDEEATIKIQGRDYVNANRSR